MANSDRFTLYKDLSEYEQEDEDVALVTPSITKKQTTKSQVVLAKTGKPRPAKYKSTTKVVNNKESIDTKAFIVHGILCQ